ncbi:MAG TPA: adenosylcobinamide-phosphate synthase CbiB [Stellaceae bacterium]|nr:adenosylcobinamide-phosphate synthase CbiB [Stellaceae bacterium]
MHTHLLPLLPAFILDFWLGDWPLLFRFVPHPIVLVGRAVTWFDRRLNREKCRDRDRRFRGVVTVLVLVAASAALGTVIASILAAFRFGWIGESLIVACLLAQRSLYDHVIGVSRALKAQGIEAGREAVRHIVGREPSSLDQHGVARAAIESLVENFSDGVVAPAFWYALLGLPGIFVYKTCNTLDSMIGHRSPRYLHFGWAAARLDDLLNLVPARLSALFLVLAAVILPGAHPGRALRVMWRDAGRHRSPNAGWPEAACAGALGLALAGPRRYGAIEVNDPWLGDGRARATPEDIDRALRLYLGAGLAQGLIVAALCFL